MAEGDSAATECPSTTAGLQAAIDALAGNKGKVFIGPGTLEITTVISLHGGCHIQGSGIGSTVIKRASGSLTSGDTIYTGNSFIITAHGSNGTPNGASEIQSDITISDMTIDGNQSAFGAVDPSTPRHMGINAVINARLSILNVRVQEFLQTGISIDEGKDVKIANVQVYNTGQYASASSRNGISLFNTSNSDASVSSGHSRGFELANIRVENVNDSCFDFVQVNDVSVSNVTTRGGQYVFEMETGSSPPASWGNITISNVNSSNNTGEFLRLTSTLTVTDILVENCTMNGHATLHTTGAILFPANAAANTSGVTVRNCVFRNINTADAASISWVKSVATSTGYANDFTLENCKFFGLTASTRTDSAGLEIAGHAARWLVSGCTFVDVPGIGVYVHMDAAGRTTQDMRFRDVTVDGANNYGFVFSSAGGATGVIKNVLLDGCTAKDVAKQASNSGFSLQAASGTAGQIVQKIRLRGCRAYKTSGTSMLYGCRLNHSGASTLDDIWFEGCDFDGTQTSPFTNAGGTPTNIHFTPRTGKGTAIASAATIAIPTDGDVFHVTGTTNITNGVTVNVWDNGRTVMLIFDDILTMTDTGTSVLQGNFTSAANDVLQLTCDGTNWIEVSRN